MGKKKKGNFFQGKKKREGSEHNKEWQRKKKNMSPQKGERAYFFLKAEPSQGKDAQLLKEGSKHIKKRKIRTAEKAFLLGVRFLKSLSLGKKALQKEKETNLSKGYDYDGGLH